MPRAALRALVTGCLHGCNLPSVLWVIVVSFALLGVSPSSVAQGVPSTIQNQAQSSYTISSNGLNGLLQSGIVSAPLQFHTPFTIAKRAITASPAETTELHYRIDVERHAGSIARPLPLTVDHVAQAYYIVSDTIPPGTTFQRFEETGGAILLYHIRGSAELSFSTAPPADLSLVDLVAVAYPDFPFGTQRHFNVVLEVTGATSGTISNTASIRFLDKENAGTSLASGAANIVLGKKMPLIRYYDESYSQSVASAILGNPLYLQIVWAAGNLDPSTVDRGRITLRSGATGDEEAFEIVETGPDTGIFRVVSPVPTRSAFAVQAEPGNAIMETVAGDIITALLIASTETEVSTTIRIDLSGGGIVFDSKTNAPLSGAKVTLINNTTGLAAAVYDFDGSTRLSATAITGADGRYSFPIVAPGSYRLSVVPPPGYKFASQQTAGEMPKGRLVEPNASYGYPFQRSGAETQWFDIPCDPVEGGGAGLFIDKVASRETVEIGETLGYTIRVKNVSGKVLHDVVVHDRLPFGFRYVEGSAAVEGKKLSDPSASKGTLEFSLGKLASDATVTLTYRTRVTIGAKEGNGINRADARDRREQSIRSNRAEAIVQIVPGVFTDRGVIIGKVFVDLNGNKIQDDGEPGIPGIRLYLEDGSYAITDSEGKYSFYGVSPRLHIVKLDNTTLPPGAKLVTLSSRNAGDPGSRFVDLTRGEMHKADFAEAGGDPAVLENVLHRRAVAENALSEIDSNLEAPLQRDAGAALSTPHVSATGVAHSNTLAGRASRDVKTLPASGVIGVGAVPFENGGGSTIGLSVAAGDAVMPRRETAPATPWSGSLINNGAQWAGPTARPPGFRDLEALPVATTGEVLAKPVAAPALPLELELATRPAHGVAFLNLNDGDVLSAAQTTVRLSGAAGAQLSLLVNGKPVASSRIGKQIANAAMGTQAVEYIGVGLKAGANTLTIQQHDPFGNLRGEKSITVTAPGRLGLLLLEPSVREARADGKSLVPVIVRLLDADGVPVSARTIVTLETSVGEWDAIDANPREPGLQVIIEGGEGRFLLKPPLEPCDAILRASTGTLKVETQISFLPELRPLIAAGVVEGRADFSNLDTAFGRRKERDSFGDELKRLTLSTGRDEAEVGGRAAFFLKGQIIGEYVLTAAYDSEKRSNERLFRDIQPDEFYPIYGDSSLKGFDAQSTSSLYAKIENKKSYLLYGDYVTQSQSDLRSLGNYNRSLTGAQLHFENERINANVWASYDNTRQIIEELPANGTSGPFAFRIASGVVNSEKVEVLTRSRNQPSLIIDSVLMTRFSDYQFEPFSGRILFKAPIPSVDENLNPISIRITYEADQGGEKFWVYGADTQIRATDWLEVGGSAIEDTNPFAPYRLYSANSAVRLEKNTLLIGEVAVSDSPFEPLTETVGHAQRLELRHHGEEMLGRLYWSRADESFRNPSASITAGRMEAGAQIGYRLDNRTMLNFEAIHTESTAGGFRRGVLAEIGTSLADRVRFEIGSRYSTESGDPYATSATAAAVQSGAQPSLPSQPDIISLRAKLTMPLPYTPDGSFYGEYENDLHDLERRVAALGVEYQATPETKVYAKHEFISSLDGQFDLNASQQKNTTVVGVQSAYMQGGQLFNEYRVRDAIDGRQSEGAIGLRNQLTVLEGLQLHGSFERVAPLVIGRKAQYTAKGVDGRPLMAAVAPSMETTAITGAFDYTSPDDWKMTGRGEYRTNSAEDAWLFTLGYAQKLAEDHSALARLIYDQATLSHHDTPGDRHQFRLQLGYAYRPVRVNIWNLLAKYELKLQEDATLIDDASSRVVHIVSSDLHWQPLALFSLSVHHASKVSFEKGNGLDRTEFASLVGVRALVDIGERWDAGATVRVMADRGGRVHYGFGPEIGFRVRRNMRLAAGYNFFGFHDPDFSSDNYTQRGVYIAFNMKFDESLLRFGRED